MRALAACCVVLAGCGHKEPVAEPETMTTMLSKHCENQHGMVAVTASPVGHFIQFYRGRKMIWRTKL